MVVYSLQEGTKKIAQHISEPNTKLIPTHTTNSFPTQENSSTVNFTEGITKRGKSRNYRRNTDYVRGGKRFYAKDPFHQRFFKNLPKQITTNTSKSLLPHLNM